MGYRVRMTRETDVSLHSGGGKRKSSDLKNRLSEINKSDVDLCVSIRQNLFSDRGTARGTQVFYSPRDEKSLLFAKSIQRSVRERLQPDNHRVPVRAGNSMFILSGAENPAVLVEFLFLSDQRDALLLSKRAKGRASRSRLRAEWPNASRIHRKKGG